MSNYKYSASSLLGMAISFLLAAWFIYAPLNSLLAHGPFSWHVAQPEFLQGGVEVLLLAAAVFVALSLSNRSLGALFGVVMGWLYGRHHGVDLSILLVVLYAEGIFALGRLILDRIALNGCVRPSSVLVAGMFGMVVWSLVIWGSSALGFGSIEAIRLISVALLGGAILAAKGPRMVTLVFRSIAQRSGIGKIVVALMLSTFMFLFAKSSVHIDFDSAWYGLQSEEVLVGSGSLYSPQGMAAVVHYYPKLYEALALPFSGLGSVSMIFGIGILSWALIGFTLAEVLREYKVEEPLRLVGVALVLTMPALANIAMTAKGDAFSAWLLLMGVLGLVKYRNGSGAEWWWISISAMILAVQARLSNIPYAGILFLLLIASLIWRRREDGRRGSLGSWGIWIFVATILLSSMIATRSLLASGVLLVAPNAAVELQKMAGLSLKYPVGILPPSDGLQRLPFFEGMYGILFAPASYPHLMITWTGNYWVFLPIAAAILGAWRKGVMRVKGAWTLLLLGISFFAVMFGYKLLVPAGDGNYFIVPIASLALWGIVQADRLADDRKRFLETLLVLFAVCGAVISFFTGAWGPGTRAIDAVMTRLPFEYRERALAGLKASKMEGVAQYFKGMPPGTRVVGVETETVSDRLPPGWWLPIQYEMLHAYEWQQPELVKSPESLSKYLQAERIGYVVVPTRAPRGRIERIVADTLHGLALQGAAEVSYQDSDHLIWRINARYRVSATLLGGGVATVAGSESGLCSSSANEIAAVSWSGGPPSVAIEVKAPTAATSSLWAEGGSSGSLKTGPWVLKGSEFVFRRGRGGPVIGRTVLAWDCG